MESGDCATWTAMIGLWGCFKSTLYFISLVNVLQKTWRRRENEWLLFLGFWHKKKDFFFFFFFFFFLHFLLHGNYINYKWDPFCPKFVLVGVFVGSDTF